MTIVFRNEHFVAVDKPCGWLSVPGRDPKDPRPCLGTDLQATLQSQIFPVHRLDFEVSGLVLFALNAAAHRQAGTWFDHRQIGKCYQAVTRAKAGPLPNETMEWKHKLVRGKRRAFEADHGREAVTRAKIESQLEGYWRWTLEPLTGRPHQLRFQLAAFGAPIVGDTLYGGEVWGRAGAIALRSLELNFAAAPEARRFGLPPILSVDSLRFTP